MQLINDEASECSGDVDIAVRKERGGVEASSVNCRDLSERGAVGGAVGIDAHFRCAADILELNVLVDIADPKEKSRVIRRYAIVSNGATRDLELATGRGGLGACAAVGKVQDYARRLLHR